MVGRRGRKAWLKGAVGRRACRNRRIAAGTFGVQFMTVALVFIEYQDGAWVLIHSHAYSEKARACIITVTYNIVFYTFEV